MSPLTLRRYRAERLLREEFEGQRSSVTAAARGRLRAGGVRLDATDLEACYAQAWQGLYAAVLEGQEIANPAGWLALVTYRRALDEHRTRMRAAAGNPRGEDANAASREPRSMIARVCASCSRDCAGASALASSRPRRSATCRGSLAPRPRRGWV
jgi:DNA-directed RNA polymerase specialized sigma24 family protein